MSEPAAHISIDDPEINLSRIVDRVEHGEEIIIDRAGAPVAKVIPLKPRVNRTGRGSLVGLTMSDDWNSREVNDSIARDFGLAP